MAFDFKEIHIGNLVESRVKEKGLEMDRICNFMKTTTEKIEELYQQKSLPTDVLLRLSKLLEYDFFRVYSHHLILYAPCVGSVEPNEKSKNITNVPKFRKRIYTKEIIDFILELEASGQKTKNQIIKEYRIPKTTLYKWFMKYRDKN